MGSVPEAARISDRASSTKVLKLSGGVSNHCPIGAPSAAPYSDLHAARVSRDGEYKRRHIEGGPSDPGSRRTTLARSGCTAKFAAEHLFRCCDDRERPTRACRWRTRYGREPGRPTDRGCRAAAGPFDAYAGRIRPGRSRSGRACSVSVLARGWGVYYLVARSGTQQRTGTASQAPVARPQYR